MIRRARYILAAAGTVAVLAGGMALAGAGTASAATFPSCATGVRCSSNSAGSAGYYGADDNHTHYRYVQTVTTAAPQLVNLNGEARNAGQLSNYQGSVGVELCDPNIGFAAQISLGSTTTGYQVRYRVGFFTTPQADPCIQNGFVNFAFSQGTPLGLNTISTNDQIALAIWYAPAGPFFHHISFSVCDITSQVCRQAYTSGPFNLNFWEFGIGAIANHVHLTGGAINPVVAMTDNEVTCYSCSHAVPISEVTPVNPFGIGGLWESQFVNLSSQVQLSPNDSLASNGNFKLWSGSTSS